MTELEPELDLVVEGMVSTWHALLSRAWRNASARTEPGFSLEEAATRLAQFGPNRICEERPPNPLVILLHQFQSPLVVILLLGVVTAAGNTSTLVWIAAVLILNAAIGFFQEREADRSVRSSPSWWRLGAGGAHGARARDRRSGCGTWRRHPARVRWPGPCRCASRGGNRAMSTESLLTGESVPVAKGLRRCRRAPSWPTARTWHMPEPSWPAAAPGLCYRDGSCYRCTRRDSHPMREVETVEPPCSAGSPASRALLASSRSPPRSHVCAQPPCATPTEMFQVAVALAVAAVPEGLPIAVTVALAVGGAWRIAMLVIRQLSAVEALGSATMIGSDKTGTLTENQMTVQQIWTGGRIYQIADGPPWSDGLDSAALPATQWPLYLTLSPVCRLMKRRWRRRRQESIQGRSHRGRLADRGGAPRHRTGGEARDASPVLAEIPFEPALANTPPAFANGTTSSRFSSRSTGASPRDVRHDAGRAGNWPPRCRTDPSRDARSR